MSGQWTTPRVVDNDMNCSLQQYLLLQHQQASMRRFSESATFPTPASTPAEEGNRPILERRTSDPGNRPAPPSRQASSELSSQLSSNPEGELYSVTLEIKNTLTQLLNQEPVQHNDSFRRWTQERLMDSERDLKEQRRSRRRGSDTSVASSRDSIGTSSDSSRSGSLSFTLDPTVLRPPVV